MFGWFKKEKNLGDVLNQTREVIIEGVRFEIRKVDPTTLLRGFKAIPKTVDTYEGKRADSQVEIAADQSLDKLKKYYADLFVGAVVRPQLTLDVKDQTKVHVDELFTNWELVEELYYQIILFTYGKKKLKLLISQKVN